MQSDVKAHSILSNSNSIITANLPQEHFNVDSHISSNEWLDNSILEPELSFGRLALELQADDEIRELNNDGISNMELINRNSTNNNNNRGSLSNFSEFSVSSLNISFSDVINEEVNAEDLNIPVENQNSEESDSAKSDKHLNSPKITFSLTDIPSFSPSLTPKTQNIHEKSFNMIYPSMQIAENEAHSTHQQKSCIFSSSISSSRNIELSESLRQLQKDHDALWEALGRVDGIVRALRALAVEAKDNISDSFPHPNAIKLAQAAE